MISRFFQSKSNIITLLIFHVIFFVIVFTNMTPDKWFIGWDSLHPEFDFLLNLKRTFFAFWQENYGVGVLTGHGFAALLPHVLVTFLISLFAADNAIRIIFTLLCLYLGGLGLYFLIRGLFRELLPHAQQGFWQNNWGLLNGIALLSSLYYVFNLATIQIFYVQLEAFIVHFAALPWLLLSTIFVLNKRSKKNIIFFAIVNFLATTQGFIPSLFVSYVTGLGIFLLVYLIDNRFKKESVRNSFFIVLFTFFINAYWFLPVGYFTFTHGDTFLNSYNNLISTPEFVERSQKFGDLQNVALLKGFFWDSYELGGPILQQWIVHQKNGIIPFIGYSVFFIAFIGFFAGLFLFKKWIFRGVSFIALYFFASIAIATPPFSWITAMIQWLSPTYNQAFRAAFTKFGLGNGFFYSILFAFGLFVLLSLLQKIAKKHIILYFVIVLMGVGLLFYAKPLFQGNLIYNKLLLNIPSSYLDLMTFFKTKGDGRIADFPQDCPEGWYSYQWGYFGSGFLWYGVNQPILGRSFDVWSPYNESYYWQISQAIREKDFVKVDKIFDKYGVKWVVYDQNYIYCRDEKGVFSTTDFIDYLSASPNYQLVREFDAKDALPIKVYERILPENNYVTTTEKSLRNIGPKTVFTDNDISYEQNGYYLTDTKQAFDIYYPFTHLFSKRDVGRAIEGLTISSTDTNILITSHLPKTLQGYTIKVPGYFSQEKYVPVSIVLQQKMGNKYDVVLTYLLPSFTLDGKILGDTPTTFLLGTVSSKDSNGLTVYVNNSLVEQDKGGKYLSIFDLTKKNIVTVGEGTRTLLLEWNDGATTVAREQLLYKEKMISLPKFDDGTLQVSLAKVETNSFGIKIAQNFLQYIPESCGEPEPSHRNKYEYSNQTDREYIRMISQDSRQCLTLFIPELVPSLGYLLETKTRHLSGRSLELYVESKERPTGLDVYLAKDSQFSSQYFVLPPTFQGEVSYDIVFRNTSFNKQESMNDISEVDAWYLPYNFIKNIHLTAVNVDELDGYSSTLQSVQVSHPNEVFYKITLKKDVHYVFLSQGFDAGWIAFSSDFHFFPKHFLINNWMNGWDVSGMSGEKSRILYLFYFPQVLEYAGFLLLPIPFIYAFWPRKKKREE